jgi:hypothetical protein
VITSRLDFRIALPARTLELRVPLANGHVIAGIDATRAQIVSVRAANGVFSCDLAAQRCTAADGTQFGAP